MFLSSQAYTNTIRETIASSHSLAIAIAFWGVGSDELFQSLSGKTLRVICNLTSGGTNPKAIRALMAFDNPKMDIRQLNNLHAKVVVGEQSAVIGSANFSTNGLCLEGQECSGWEEAGFQTKSPDDVAAAQQWFDANWDKATLIKETDLKQAQERWDARYRASVFSGQNKSLMSLPTEILKNLDIYVVVCRDDSTKEAKKVYQGKLDSVTGQHSSESDSSIGFDHSEHDFYENWNLSEEQHLPKGVPLIAVGYDDNGEFSVLDTWVRNSVDGSFKYTGTEKRGEHGTITGVVRVPNWEEFNFAFEFGEKDKAKLKKGMEAFIKKRAGQNPHVCVRLSKALSLE